MALNDSTLNDWLALVCQMVPGARCGMAVFGTGSDGALEPAARWPAQATPSEGLSSVARLALSRGAPVVAGADGDTAAALIDVAHPLKNGEEIIGVVAVSAQVPQAQQQAVIQVLRWGAAWLDLLSGLPPGENSTPTSLALESICAALDHEPLRASATAIASLIAHRLSCDQVAVGLLRGGDIEIIALSDTSSFDARSNLLRRLQGAMHEAMTKAATEIPEITEHAGAAREHRGHAFSDVEGTIQTVLLRHQGQVIGAISMQRGPQQEFESQSVAQCEAAADLVAPVLELKRERERSAVHKLTDMLARLSGPKGLGVRIALVAFLAIVFYLSFTVSEFRITAAARLEGTVHRAVVAPYDGYIAAAHARAGDTVKGGQPLAELDDRDLQLEHRKWTGEREALNKQHRQALAIMDRAQARIVGSRIEQVQARIALVEEQLARSRMTAPFDGVVIAGDLSRALGSPVERGKLLFEIAPLDEYRVVLEVSDWDISEIRVAQRGQLTLSSIPGQAFEFVVTNISSISQNEDGQPTFRVEAQAEGAREYLRPGMGGIGKIVIGERKLLWIWTRPLLLRLNLWLWEWLP